MTHATRPFAWFAAALCAAMLQPSAIGAAGADETVQPVFAGQLPNVPGNSLTAVLVKYEPGGKTEAHHHAGSVFAHVLSGAIIYVISNCWIVALLPSAV